MALDKFVLIVVLVGAVFGGTLWVGTLLVAAVQLPFGWIAFVPALIAAFVMWRVIEQRLSNAEDDHYDRIEK